MFLREVLREPVAEVAIRRAALPLLEVGIAPEIVLEVAFALNDRRRRPAPIHDVERLLLEAARLVARGRRRIA